MPTLAATIGRNAMSARPRGSRILVQVNSLALGGTQLNAVDLAWAIEPLGFECVLIGPRDTLPPGPSLFDVAAERGVRLEAFDRPSTTLRGARDLSRLARKHGSQVIHTYGSWSSRPAYWGPCFAARRPLVMTVYEMSVAADTFRAPDLIIGTRYLLEDLAGRRGRVHLISPPVDLSRDDSRVIDAGDFLSASGLDPSHQRIVIVSRLDEEMKALSVELSIKAFAELHGDDVDLVIAGSGDAEERASQPSQGAARGRLCRCDGRSPACLRVRRRGDRDGWFGGARARLRQAFGRCW